ncbi:MAG: phage tail protein [Lentimicrobium sp.]|nr:phage tail protein [Lentimicrobium sp.]
MEIVVINSGNASHEPFYVRPKDSAQSNEKLLGEDIVKLDFESYEALAIEINDWIEVFGRKYYINTSPIVSKRSSRGFVYECTFESKLYDLSKVGFLDVDASGIHISHEFTLTGDLDTFCQIIFNNLTRIYGAESWSCVNRYTGNLNEVKTLSFSEDTCLSALRKISKEYGVEYFYTDNAPEDEFRFTLYLDLIGGEPVLESFEYGKGNGLTEIKRKNASSSNFITRLYAFGSSRNLGANYRNYSPRLRLPATHTLPDIYVTKGVEIDDFPNTHIYGQTNAAFVQLQVPDIVTGWSDWGQAMSGSNYNAGQALTYTQPPKQTQFRVKAWSTPGKFVFSDGSYEGWSNTGSEKDYVENLEAVQRYGIIEKVVIFDEVFPHRTGVVTGLGDAIHKFSDSSMFDLNEFENGIYTYLISGLTAKIHFNTGNLAGYEFEVWNYSHATKTFSLNKYTDERGLVFPNSISPAFQINVGDEYVILDIKLPQSYVDTAESLLLQKATEWLNKYSNPQLALDVKLDELFVAQNELDLALGNLMHVVDESFGINAIYRIEGITRNLLRESKYQITLAEDVYRGRNANFREINKNGGRIYKTVGTSGVTTFNTRTGDVTLLKADVESVLTGDVNTHTHSAYVLKAGDTMTNYLNIHRTGNLLMTALSIKNEANSSYIMEGLITSNQSTVGSGQFHIRALMTVNGSLYEHNIAYATMHPIRGRELTLAGDNYDRINFGTKFEVIGNATYVYCETSTVGVARIPIASFGGGSGTVTSVGLSAPSALFSVSGSPVATSGTLGLSLETQIKNYIFAAPASANGTPSFRALTAADIPALSYDNYADWNLLLSTGADVRIMKSGSTQTANYYKGMKLVAGTNVTLSGANDNGYYAVTINAAGGSGGSGTVTSVALTAPNIFGVTGSPVTTIGTLALSLAAQTANRVWAGPVSGGSAQPTFRSLVAADIPALPYDNYGNWRVTADTQAIAYISKSGGNATPPYYDGIKFISGSGITITPGSGLNGFLNIQIDATGGGSGTTNWETEVQLASNTSTISASTWTTVNGMTLSSLADGTYLVTAHITMVKASTTGAVVAMRITDGMFQSFAATEQYASSVTTNRVNMSVSTIIKIKGGAPSSVSLQMWASTTGWYAAASTPSSSQAGATRMTAVQLY